MKQTKLIINYINNDVIVTSNDCSSVWGVVEYSNSEAKVMQNGSKEKDNSFTNEASKLTGYNEGYYHIDENGNVLGVCPQSKNYAMGVDSAHGTDFCLAEGIKVTLADGTVKNIEDFKIGDEVLTFNHETGELEVKEIYLAYKGKDKAKSFTLKFTNGIELSIVGMHDLFEKEENKYVTISDDNALNYVGKHFYNVIDKRFEELLAVTFNKEEVNYYSLYTNNINCITNNMLSAPDDVDAFLNIYEFKEDLTADLDVLNKDIEKYGLFDISETKRIKEEDTEKLSVKYVKIVVGKGLMTMDEIINLNNEYVELAK